MATDANMPPRGATAISGRLQVATEPRKNLPPERPKFPQTLRNIHGVGHLAFSLQIILRPQDASKM
eukprot:1650368-Pyramimonas_sp.AAC.1